MMFLDLVPKPDTIASSAMAPNLPSTTATEYLPSAVAVGPALPEATKTTDATSKDEPYRIRLVWRNIIAFTYLHLGALYGLYLCVTLQAKALTIVWIFVVAAMGAMGITAGAHRLWSHRAYKAKWPLRLLLATFQTMAFQNHIHEWVRDHRVHHKFSETNADPHNATRGFFFSHIGWLLCRKHPDVRRKGITVDMSDMEADPIVVWQRRTYLVLMPFVCFALPVWLPCYLWGETGWTSWYVAGVMRYVLSLNATWLVNSAAHIWGVKPYDKSISPTENVGVAIAAFGEGWHNYHHVFPWDYKAAELGNYRMNFTTAFIDFFARIGWAYDLKAVPAALVKKRAERTGDGSWPNHHHHHQHGETALWGWGDKDMSADDRQQVEQLDKTTHLN